MNQMMYGNGMLPSEIFYPQYAEEITCDTRVRLLRRGYSVMNICEALKTMYSLQSNRMNAKRLAEIIMGNHYVKQRMNLREKEQEIAVNTLEYVLYPQVPNNCLVSVDRHRRKVVPFNYCRTFRRRNLVTPIRPISNKMETQPQGTAMAKRAWEVGKSECFAVMVEIRLARMECKRYPPRKGADFQLVYLGCEPIMANINSSGVNL
jgi:hypothetical protein